MKLRPLSIRFCSTGSPMSPLCRKLRCPCAAVLPRTRGNGCRVKFQATTGRFPCVSRRCLSPLFFSFSFSFSLFLAPSFVIDTRAKRISIRPLDDAIYLQLVPRPPTDAPRSNKESRNPLSSLSPPSLLPPFPLSIVRFGNRANFSPSTYAPSSSAPTSLLTRVKLSIHRPNCNCLSRSERKYSRKIRD